MIPSAIGKSVSNSQKSDAIMEWTNEGIVLGLRRHGEASAILQLLTSGHGRHAGLVRGATSARLRGLLQPGNRLRATWRARLADHLGTYSVEPVATRSLAFIEDAAALDALNAVCALVMVTIPEREPHPAIFEGLDLLLSSLDDQALWPALLVRWELGLLQELGFALDLARCAVTGQQDMLTHVSPRTGRAVSQQAAGPYEGRLLLLPPFLLGSQAIPASMDEIREGLRLTGHFLDNWVLAPHGLTLPDARQRFISRLFD